VFFLKIVFKRWLERTPGLKEKNFNFWKVYRFAVDGYLKELQEKIEAIVCQNTY
jgi:hypothetical protein